VVLDDATRLATIGAFLRAHFEPALAGAARGSPGSGGDGSPDSPDYW
jgi:hypothetical protein